MPRPPPPHALAAATHRRIVPRAKPRHLRSSMSGGPQPALDLFDPKPHPATKVHGEEVPESVFRKGQSASPGMTAGQSSLPSRSRAPSSNLQKIRAPPARWTSTPNCIPAHSRGIADEHLHPRALHVHRGHQPRPGDHLFPNRLVQLAGRPSVGAWLRVTGWARAKTTTSPPSSP